MAVKTKALLLSEIATAVNDNTAGDVTPADVRGQLVNIVDSVHPEAAPVVPGYVITGGVVDVTQRLGVLSLTGNQTLTLSATPAAGSLFSALLHADGTDRTVTVPSSKSFARGATITSFIVPANGSAHVVWYWDGTTYHIYGDPVTPAQVKAALAISAGDVSGLATVATTGAAANVSGLAPIATSGSAADLSAGVLAPARIAAGGTPLQMVRINAGGTALEYAAPGSGSGDVVGPASAVDGGLVVFDTTTGKLVKLAPGWGLSAEGELTRSSDGIPGSWGLGDASDPPKFVHWSAPTTLTDEYTFSIPAVMPTAGQALVVDSVTGSVVQLKGAATSGSGTVTKVSVATANGVSGSVANDTTTPAITISLGAITPSTVNGVTLSGSSTPTLAVTGTSAISGTNTGDNAVNSNYSSLVSNATHTGDATGATALTLATVNSNVGSFGSATAAPAVTVNAKGLVTAVTTNTVTPAVGSITGLGTGVATALAINVGSAGAPVVNGGALGTPSSGTLTNCTMKDQIGVACSDETTAITAGTGKLTFRMPFAMTLTAVRASVTTAPTGANLIIDINEGGTTILSTKLSIDATEKTSTTAATAAVISDTALADDAEITIDFDQVGSTVAGAGVKVWLIGTRS
jgi:hypothetical protein